MTIEAQAAVGSTGPLAVTPKALTTEELQRLGDLNLAEFMRHTARYGGTVLEEDGLLLVAGNHPQPGPYRNAALLLDVRLPPAEALRRADEFFGARSRSFVFWVRDHADGDELDALAVARGMQLLEPDGLPELSSQEQPEPIAPPPGVDLRFTDDERSRADFVLVNAESWGMPGTPLELASAMFFHPDSAGAPNVAGVLAYVDGSPASGAMALVSHGVVGGYWGATAPWARRRGLGDLCVRTMFIAGFALGARAIVCQASGMGEQIWRRMGLERMTSYRRYLGRPSAGRWE